MGKYLKDKDIYVKQSPEVKRWLNQCVICQSIGYKPELPERIDTGMLAQNIRKYFTILCVNELHICDECDNQSKSYMN